MCNNRSCDIFICGVKTLCDWCREKSDPAYPSGTTKVSTTTLNVDPAFAAFGAYPSRRR